MDLLIVAGRYTLAEQNGIGELRQTCTRNGVGIVIASVFNSGLLAKPNPSTDARCDYGVPPTEFLAHVAGIEEVCGRYGVMLPTAVLQYAADDPLVRSVVLGTARADQLRANLDRLSASIPPNCGNRFDPSSL